MLLTITNLLKRGQHGLIPATFDCLPYSPPPAHPEIVVPTVKTRVSNDFTAKGLYAYVVPKMGFYTWLTMILCAHWQIFKCAGASAWNRAWTSYTCHHHSCPVAATIRPPPPVPPVLPYPFRTYPYHILFRLCPFLIPVLFCVYAVFALATYYNDGGAFKLKLYDGFQLGSPSLSQSHTCSTTIPIEWVLFFSFRMPWELS